MLLQIIFYFNSFFGHFEKQGENFVPRSPGSARAPGADASLVPHRELMHSQEKLDVVEVLVLQIPHPLQRIILSIEKGECWLCGKCWEL